MVGVAQLVRASDCGPEGRGFDPHLPPHIIEAPFDGVFFILERKFKMRVILASASPRRKELLKKIFDVFEVIPSEVEENYPEKIEAKEIPVYLSDKKATSVFVENPDALVIASDTVVVLDDMILGKPSDKNDAFFMLSMLSGKQHKVVTGVTIIYRNMKITMNVETVVSFFEMSKREILEYIETGEPMDKAGAYGIQGYGARFVESIIGDYNNVVGLPVSALYQTLKENGILR